MAADDPAVWVTAARSIVNFDPVAGILLFGGRSWTRYVVEDAEAGNRIEEIAVAPDGTICHTHSDVPYQLEP